MVPPCIELINLLRQFNLKHKSTQRWHHEACQPFWDAAWNLDRGEGSTAEQKIFVSLQYERKTVQCETI